MHSLIFMPKTFPVPVQLNFSGTPLGALTLNSEGFSFSF